MIRGGKLNDANFGTRMTGIGGYADYMHQLVHALSVKYNMVGHRNPLATHLFQRPGEFDFLGR